VNALHRKTKHERLEALAARIAGVSRYEAAWLPNDVMAGLVLTTMLVPVGIAYAVASGVPGIYGLYATIVPLLAYAPPGPDASWCWDRILLAAVILACCCRSPPEIRRAVLVASLMAVVSAWCASWWSDAPGVRHRAAVADPLRLHERHRADGADQPAAQAVRLFDRQRRTGA
jgi:hypothetical protein